MDYDDNFDEEQFSKLINSQISMLNDKFKIYDKMIYENNPKKSKLILFKFFIYRFKFLNVLFYIIINHLVILPYYKIRYNENLSHEANVDKMNTEFENKQSFYENK